MEDNTFKRAKEIKQKVSEINDVLIVLEDNALKRSYILGTVKQTVQLSFSFSELGNFGFNRKEIIVALNSSIIEMFRNSLIAEKERLLEEFKKL